MAHESCFDGCHVKTGRLRNSNGQFTIEAVLLIAVFSTIALYTSKQMRDQGIGSKLVEGPWMPVRGMIEDGVWNGNMKEAMAYHPSVKRRHATARGNPTPQQ